MCGRYELHANPAAIALALGLASPPSLEPRYNIAPMQLVPIVRVNAHGEREIVHVRWGLVPRWAKDPSIGARMINARGETVADKPAFRTAYRRHRVLLPASGFYEWMARAVGKQPMHIAMKDGAPFAFAGLAEELGLGTNPRARLTGKLMTDEKVMGTIHIAIGDNASPSYGGTNEAPIHIDGVVGQPTLIVDGDTLIREGDYLI